MAGSLDLSAVSQAAQADAQNAPQGDLNTQDTGVQADGGASQVAAGDPGAGGGVPGAAAADPGAAGASQAQAWGLREELKAIGLDVSQFQDDKSAWGYVQQRLQHQAHEFERQRQALAYYQQQIQALQQPKAETPKPDAKAPWWQPPEYDPIWEKPFSKDKDGNYLTPADLDHNTRIKLDRYREWQRESFGNLLRDPIGTLKPGLQEFVAPLIQEAIQQHLGRYKEQQFVNNFIGDPQVADWMYQKDALGNRLTDYSGRPVLTQGGQLFVQKLAWAEQNGIRDVQAQQRIASDLVELEIHRARAGQQQQTPADKNAALKATALQRGNGATRLPSSGSGPAVPATTASGGNRGVDPRVKLRDELLTAIKQAGGV